MRLSSAYRSPASTSPVPGGVGDPRDAEDRHRADRHLGHEPIAPYQPPGHTWGGTAEDVRGDTVGETLETWLFR